MARSHWDLFSSAYAIEEARRNILVKYPTCAQRLEELILQVSSVAQPSHARSTIALPQKDQPIFEAALAGGVTHLLTRDLKDFGPHMNQPEKCAGIIIQTVADYLRGMA